MTTITATYSPDDNKLRLSASTRLPRDLYDRVKAAGFAWAPKQDQFIAPMWTPERADLCMELAGAIDDDDGSLMERAEERSVRFEGYEERRAADAVAAHAAVQRIADGIPLGQPILVGHHSQRHAERDAKRIEDGMRRAVRAFETSEYWKHRAAAAIRHAKYKERTDVRARRIKGLEAHERAQVRNIESAQACARIWDKVPRFEWDKQTGVALLIAGHTCGPVPYGLYSDLRDGKMHGDTAWRLALEASERSERHHARWLGHYRNRLEYERAMLADAGGTVAQNVETAGQTFEVGGRVKVRGEWVTVRKVNKRSGVVTSLTTDRQYVSTVTLDEIAGYEAPAPEVADAAKAAAKVPPLVNYEGEGFHVMTRAEWAAINGDYKGTRELGQGATMRYGREPDAPLIASQAAGQARHRVRSAYLRGALAPVFISDEKAKPAPLVGQEKPARCSFKPKAADAEFFACCHAPVDMGHRDGCPNNPERDGLPNDPDDRRFAAYECGRRARAEGLTFALNPYASKGASAEADAWAKGFDAPPTDAPPATHSDTDPPATHSGRAHAAALGADPEQVAAIVATGMLRPTRGDGRAPWSHDIKREADGLLAIAEQPDFNASDSKAYRAAALHLLDLADEARARERAATALPATHSQADDAEEEADDGAREHCPQCDCEHVPGATRCSACAGSMDGAETFLPEPDPLPTHSDAEPTPRAELDRGAFLAMRDTLRNGGVKTVSAPQLFPTPPDVARRMVELAGIFHGARVLEPSAGTGRLIDAWLSGNHTGTLVAVEVVRELGDGLHRRYDVKRCGPGRHVETITADFLSGDLEIGTFDAVLMNPPFADFADMQHVRQAFRYLGDGGRLVAIMSSGVTFRSDRKTREFREWVARLGGEFEELPPGTFESSGTGVNTVLVVLKRPEDGPDSLRAQRTGEAA